MNRRVALRFDASTTIGHGHLTRCLAIAEELVASGCECIAITRSAPALPIPRVDLPAEVTAEEEGAFVRARVNPAVVVADLYQSSPSQLDALRSAGALVRIEDEETTPPTRCALLVNPNFGELPAELVAAAGQYLGGSNAIILRRQFRQLPSYNVRARVRRALVCFGGSDPVNATPRAVRALRQQTALDIERIDVVVGGAFPWSTELGAEVGDDTRFAIHRAVDDMAAILTQADLGILAAGTLLYEALAVGLPSIFVSITPSQTREAQYAHDAGAARYVGSHDRLDLDAHLAALVETAVRRRLSDNARRLVDGNGSSRVAALIATLVEAS